MIKTKAVKISNRPSYVPEITVFLISITIYLLTLAPTVTGEDSGELISAAYGLGVAHPPGYPLWTMLSWLSIKLFAFGSVAFRANLLSAVLASGAAFILCRILIQLFDVSPAFAVLGSILFAVGTDFWSQAVIAEVYTLQVFLTCLILYCFLLWHQKQNSKYLYCTAFLVGLALTNHQATILLLPVLFFSILIFNPKVLLSLKTISMCLLLFALGLTPYLYLPWAAGHNPYMNWGNPSDWQGFIRHVLRKQYADESMHSAHTLNHSLGHLGILWNLSAQQFTAIALPFAFVGMISLWRKNLKFVFYTLLAVFLINTVGFAEILNINFSRQELYCFRVFLLPAYIILAVWITIGCQEIINVCFSHLRFLPKAIGPLLILVLALVALVRNYPENNMHNYYYAQDHADNILNDLEPNAVLIPSGDHNTFPVIFRHYVQGIRPDITIADKYGYIEYSLYQSMPKAPKIVSTLSQRTEIETFLIKTAGKPIYYTVKPRPNFLEGYKTVAFGMLFKVVQKNESDNIDRQPFYNYRNLAQPCTAMDNAAEVILSDYYFYLASNALRQCNNVLAMENIAMAAKLSDGLKEEMNNLGTLLAEFGKNNEAITFYQKAAILDKKYTTPRWNLAYLFKAQGDTLHAIQVFNDLAQIEPSDYRIFGEIGFLLHQYGDSELAIKNWGISLSLNPNQPQIVEAMSKSKNTTSISK